MENRILLDRRTFLKASTIMMAGTSVLGTSLLTSCSTPKNEFHLDVPIEVDKNRLKMSAEEVIKLKPGFSGKKPNIILIVADDLGWGDLSLMGTKSLKTPNLDVLAKESVRFSNFYSCNALCSPSRAGMLTGRYPQRCGVDWVLFGKDEPLKKKMVRWLGGRLAGLGVSDMDGKGKSDHLLQDEITLAQALKVGGYHTGIIGKWHLGNFGMNMDYHPSNYGFDHVYSCAMSNSQSPNNLYHNQELVNPDVSVDQSGLTDLWTREAINYIDDRKDATDPFFLYLAYTAPHQPFHPSGAFKGKSNGGIYGDVVEELDAGIGRVLDNLKVNGLDEDTIVIFTSDNGAWFEGSKAGLRGAKGQSYEGGMRVPLLIRWKGKSTPGLVENAPATNIDLFPTLLSLAGLELPKDRIIDGENISFAFKGESGETYDRNRPIYYYHLNELEGIRVDKWKYIHNINCYMYPAPINRPQTFSGKMGLSRRPLAPLGEWPYLYNLDLDPFENYNTIKTHPKRGDVLLTMMRQWHEGMKKNIRGWQKT